MYKVGFFLVFIQRDWKNPFLKCQIICNMFCITTLDTNWNLVLERHFWKPVRALLSDKLLQIMSWACKTQFKLWSRRLHYIQNQLYVAVCPEQAHTEMSHSMCTIIPCWKSVRKQSLCSSGRPGTTTFHKGIDHPMTTELLHGNLAGVTLDKANLHLAKRGQSISRRIWF